MMRRHVSEQAYTPRNLQRDEYLDASLLQSNVIGACKPKRASASHAQRHDCAETWPLHDASGDVYLTRLTSLPRINAAT